MTAEWEVPKRRGTTITVDVDSTGATGTVTMDAPACKVDGTVNFTITDVSIGGYIYDPELNNETSESITFPQ